MHIKKFDRQFSRRHFFSQVTAGVLTTGVLKPLWPQIASAGNIDGVYPDEIMSIDEYTKGAISNGDEINTGNVHLVKELLDPIQYKQVLEMGRVLKIRPTTRDILRLSPREYIEATLNHAGMARFRKDGNVVTQDGQPWIGGNPFPNPKSALEVFAAITLSWGRHDASAYAVKEYDLDEYGDIAYRYQSYWVEYSPVGRLVLEPRPHWPGHEDKLRYQSVFFVSPTDARGTSYLNVWPYDQNQYPDLFGYIPSFKRVRRFPTNQRFEPLIPGSTLYLSDAWAAGDPFLTWGNYRIVHRGPMLAAVSESWNPSQDNWQHNVHGGEKGQSFWDTQVELVPEAIVVEAEPTGYPRAPVSKKRVWFDARTSLPVSMVSYDRRGDIFRSFDGAFSLYQKDGQQFMDGKHPYWSWTRLHAHNVQTNRITRMEQVREVTGGYKTTVNEQKLYDRFLTRTALRRLGS